jgi:hypothetical protein
MYALQYIVLIGVRTLIPLNSPSGPKDGGPAAICDALGAKNPSIRSIEHFRGKNVHFGTLVAALLSRKLHICSSPLNLF